MLSNPSCGVKIANIIPMEYTRSASILQIGIMNETDSCSLPTFLVCMQESWEKSWFIQKQVPAMPLVPDWPVLMQLRTPSIRSLVQKILC